MSDQYSPAWWNEQAQAKGRLTKADIEALTGQTFDTQLDDPSLGTITPWTYRVAAEAPGFAAAGLLLRQDSQLPPTADPRTDIAAWANYPEATFESPVGYVAPGATGPWEPELSDEGPATVEQRVASLEERVARLEEK